MRLGLIGPAGDDGQLLEQATELLIGPMEADAILYLGIDDAIDEFVERRRVRATHPVYTQMVDTAISGSESDIRSVQRAFRQARDLATIRIVPRPPHRAIEMVDDRIVVVVYDKALLGEDDILSANLVLYGKSGSALFKRFGPRSFFTPGPLADGQLGLLEEDPESGVILRGLDLGGVFTWREPIHGQTAKVTVAQ